MFIMLSELPVELLLLICAQMGTDKDTNALARVDRRLWRKLDRNLYARNFRECESSSLKWAILKDRKETIQKALDFGADINAILNFTKSDVATYKELMERGQLHLTALSLATLAGNAEIVEVLLSKDGIDVNCQNTAVYLRPIFFAAEKGNVSIARMLLDVDTLDATTGSLLDGTPLVIAARGGFCEIVELILDRERRKTHGPFSAAILDAKAIRNPQGAVIFYEDRPEARSRWWWYGEVWYQEAFASAPYREEGETAIAVASQAGHEDVVRILIQAGANPHSWEQTGYRYDPIYLAARNGRIGVLKLLFDSPLFDMTKLKERPEEMMEAALFYCNPDLFEFIYDRTKGLEKNWGQRYGRTALWWSAARGYDKILLSLLKEGFDINAKSQNCPTIDQALNLAPRPEYRESLIWDNWTPLVVAVDAGYLKVVQILLDQPGIDIHWRDQYNEGAIERAALAGWDDVQDLLYEKGAENFGVSSNDRLEAFLNSLGNFNRPEKPDRPPFMASGMQPSDLEELRTHRFRPIIVDAKTVQGRSRLSREYFGSHHDQLLTASLDGDTRNPSVFRPHYPYRKYIHLRGATQWPAQESKASAA